MYCAVVYHSVNIMCLKRGCDDFYEGIEMWLIYSNNSKDLLCLFWVSIRIFVAFRGLSRVISTQFVILQAVKAWNCRFQSSGTWNVDFCSKTQLSLLQDVKTRTWREILIYRVQNVENKFIKNDLLFTSSVFYWYFRGVSGPF